MGAVKLMRSTIRSTERCWRPLRRGHALQIWEGENGEIVGATTRRLEVSRAAEGSGDGNKAAEALEEAASRAYLASRWPEQAEADVGALRAKMGRALEESPEAVEERVRVFEYTLAAEAAQAADSAAAGDV